MMEESAIWPPPQNADFLVRFLVMCGAWKILEVAISPPKASL